MNHPIMTPNGLMDKAEWQKLSWRRQRERAAKARTQKARSFEALHPIVPRHFKGERH